ncbi:MAG: hypothetical protein HY055_14250 [Magnetospirillum sp.]|nr:hypothetical protein [Magnetospirillum sp.]
MNPQSITYSADGLCATFGFAFPVLDGADLEVSLNGTVQTGGYTVLGGEGITPGGAVVFASAPAIGNAVTLRRTGKVQVSGSDAQGFLEAKIVAGANVSVTKTSDANGEHLSIAATADPALFLRKDQNLADLADKAAARSNLGLAAIAVSGSYTDLADKPSLGSAAALNVDTDGALAANSDSVIPSQKAVKTYAAAKSQNLADLPDKAAARSNLGLAAIAASGSYADLANKPSLGSAAALNVDTDGTLAANSDSVVSSQKAVKTYVDGKVGSTISSLSIDIRNLLRQALSSAIHNGLPAEGLFNGICDAFNADTIGANSSGQSYDPSGHFYRNAGSTLMPIVTPGTIVPIGGGQTIIDMDGTNMALARTVVAEIGIYLTSPMSGIVPKIARRISAGHFDIVATAGTVNHGGTGWEWFGLATPYTVPNDAYNYFPGCYLPSTFSSGVSTSTANPFDAYNPAGDITGNNQSLTEESGASATRTAAMAVRYQSTSMTLVTNTLLPAPAGAPSEVLAVMLWKDVSGSAALNTDLTIEATRDASNWSSGTLVDSGLTISGFKVLWADIDVSGQPSGTSVKLRIKALNNKGQQVKGIALLTK